MYLESINLQNTGPIDRFEITLPFEGGCPKPVLLVGPNGSGKSVFLSFIVNGLMRAQQVAYPEIPEIEGRGVYKLRHPLYVKSGAEYSYGEVVFEEGLYSAELMWNKLWNKFKKPSSPKPTGLSGQHAQKAWDGIAVDGGLNPIGIFSESPENKKENKRKCKEVFRKNCVLYFPSNRFEEPAWLNEEKLTAKAEHMNLKKMAGYTSRRIINKAPLRENQNWVFGVEYDANILGYNDAGNIYDAALKVVRSIFRANGKVGFGVGPRQWWKVALVSTDNGRILVPNLFQLSSGETSLLNLFLSILRDFDLSGAPFTTAADVRGIVVVDEIDLHLHAVHQHDILPELVKMFPQVQFIITTHSPLFVLGMEKIFGKDDFELYRLPQGERISPEEFEEYGEVAAILKLKEPIQKALEETNKPLLFVEGITDIRYLGRAAEVLGKQDTFKRFKILDGGGAPGLNTIRKHTRLLRESIKRAEKKTGSAVTRPRKSILLYDCECHPKENPDGDNLHARIIPLQETHPVREGIENLFSRETLERMPREYRECIEITKRTPWGSDEWTEEWKIKNKKDGGRKMQLCDWLCENGTLDDFKHFACIFEILEQVLGDETGVAESPGAGSS